MSEFSPKLESALSYLTEVGEQLTKRISDIECAEVPAYIDVLDELDERHGKYLDRLDDRCTHLETLSLPPGPQYDKLYAALAKAQGEIQAAEANKEAEIRKKDDYSVVLYTFKYADLAACLEVIRKPLSDNGLALIQIPSLLQGNVVQVKTILGHESGQSIDCTMTMIPGKEGPQAIGTCISYLRRYSLSAMIGVAQFDDDAQSAIADPDDYERLTPEQIDEILVLADKHFKQDADAKVNRMLDKAFQVTAVGDIPSAHFDSAINLLNNQAKREKAQAKLPKPKADAEIRDQLEKMADAGNKPLTTESKEEPGADG